MGTVRGLFTISRHLECREFPGIERICQLIRAVDVSATAHLTRRLQVPSRKELDVQWTDGTEETLKPRASSILSLAVSPIDQVRAIQDMSLAATMSVRI